MSRFSFPDEIKPHHKAFLGKTGSGKTSSAKLFIEQVIDQDGARVCVLDTVKSDWWGLISSSDGKKPGLPFVVLGGPRGHLPLHSSAGKAIAEVVASGQLRHSIIDMADFEAGGIQRFFVDFAPALLRNMRGVLYLVIEEAHELAPKERSGFDKENMAVHYAKKLATAGRSKGIRLLVLTQRTQALHNAVLGSCEVLVAHRLTSPADQEPVQKWLRANATRGQADTIAESMSGLRTGSAWLVSGEAKLYQPVSFPRIKTYDNTATPDDDTHAHEVASAQVDQDQLRNMIGAAAKHAEENDPKVLKAEVARLRAELARKVVPAAIPTNELKAAEHRGYELGVSAAHAALKPWLDAAGRATHTAWEAVNKLESAGDDLPAMRAPGWSVAGIVAHPEHKAAQRRANGEAERRMDAATSGLPAGELRVLKAIAMYEEGVERGQLTVLTGYKKSSRDAYVSRLYAKNLVIAGPQNTIRISDAGIKALGSNYEPLPTGAALRDYWLTRLRGGEATILLALTQVYPKALDRGELSARTQYKKSSRDAYISRLAARKVIELTDDGVKMADALAG